MVKVASSRLPITAAKLFGRDDDLAWLDRCWNEGVHVASIVAWGGVGKSALVNTWRNRLRDAGWPGVERVFDWSFYSQGTTDRMTSADEFISAALRWFGDPDPTAGSPWDKGDRLAELVGGQRTLLILDGVEPLQWGPGAHEGIIKDPALQALVRGLAGQNRGMSLITTRLRVADLEAFAGDKVREKKLEHLSPEAGAELLGVRGARGTPEELRQAAEEYDGHCLALTLLGSFLDEVCDGDIRQRSEIRLFESDDRYGIHARRIMAAYDRWFAGEAEVAILRMLSLFDRPSRENEIAALREEPVIRGLTNGLQIEGTRAHRTTLRKVHAAWRHHQPISAKEWKRAVSALQRAGLLTTEIDATNQQTLDTHPLVRQHFGEHLRREHPEAWREGHRRLYEHLKKAAKPFPDNLEDMTPLYEAVIHGCLAGEGQEALREVHLKRIHRGDEAFSIKKLGAFGNEIAVFSALFESRWERLAPGLGEPEQSLVLHDAGFVLRALGRLPEATELTKLALERALTRGDWEKAASNASSLGELLMARGELTGGLAYLRQSVAHADKSGDRFLRMVGRTKLATILHAMGQAKEAHDYFQEGEQMQKQWQPAHPLLYSLRGFQYCSSLIDERLYADVRARVAQTLHWEAGRTLDVALGNLSLGRAHLLASQHGSDGDLAQATDYLRQASEGLRRAGAQEFVPLGLLARADLYAFTRDFSAARRDLDEAHRIATRCGFRLHEADAHLGYARLHLAEGNPIAATESLARARAIITDTGYHRRDGELARLETEAREAAPRHVGVPREERQDEVVAFAPSPRAPANLPSSRSTHAITPVPIDFLLVTALEEERDALLAKLPGARKLDRDGTGAHTYYKARVQTKRQDQAAYRVIVTSLSGMGPTKAAIKAGAIIQRWNPPHVLMVGIAGGVEGEVALGDVVVASQVADHTLGKVHERGPREERWVTYPADADLLDAATNFPTGWEDLVTIPRPGDGAPKRRIGVIASGGDVIASPKQIAAYRQDWPKLIGVEMEGGGLAAGLHDDIARPRFLMIRGVSDLRRRRG
ncbi:MAG: hypothetical protein QM820_25545 [Minicystis sp.]